MCTALKSAIAIQNKFYLNNHIIQKYYYII